jgi:predicted MFS family arabinose efflux permease
MGVAMCYFLNGISFIALVWSGFVIKSDLKPVPEERGPLKDLIFEGATYTFHDRRLRTLFLLETITACFGLGYMPLLPSYLATVLHFPEGPSLKAALGAAYTAIGIGALCGLLLGVRFADYKDKGQIIKLAMGCMASGLLALALTRNQHIAFALVGMGVIVQFNTTNALFQILSPDRLRGRVLAMHIWTINGLSPIGILLCGQLASQRSGGVALALLFCGVTMAFGTLAAILSKRGLSNLLEGA